MHYRINHDYWSTGRPGGRRTGDHVADYALEGGRLLAACQELLTANFEISWYDRFPTVEHVLAGQGCMASIPDLAQAIKPVGQLQEDAIDAAAVPVPANKSNRLKYSCGGCAAAVSVWGKPRLKHCGPQLDQEQLGTGTHGHRHSCQRQRRDIGGKPVAR